MTNQWDEFSKSLTQPVPRRESLRRLGLVFGTAVLSSLGLHTAFAGHQDPCKAFCRCRSKSQQKACLTACNGCNKDTSRLCGAPGTYVCCGNEQACCSGYCTDLARDPYNCSACGYACDEPGPYDYGACIDGNCEYACVGGADYCYGTCTFLGSDPDNCGACGNICAGTTPYTSCIQGTCHSCGSNTNFNWDNSNCGWCGNVCPQQFTCVYGVCEGSGGSDGG